METKERPILFSTPMVQAILDGRKTQTRRTHDLNYVNTIPSMWRFLDRIGGSWKNKVEFVYRFIHNETLIKFDIACPYGKVGDVLWVRETFSDEPQYYFIYKADNKGGKLYLGTDDEGPQYCDVEDIKWKPSIFMPKEACRIRLEITDIRVERLQDISEDDAKAEGVIPFKAKCEEDMDCWTDGKHKTAYNYLWNEINGWNPNSWEKNPWVWVITFNII
jgi:hypothetical protein